MEGLKRYHDMTKAELISELQRLQQPMAELTSPLGITCWLNVLFIGGGKGCHDFLKLLHSYTPKHITVNILGVADPLPDAPGRKYAEERGIPTSSDYLDFLYDNRLNLIIELTNQEKILDTIFEKKLPKTKVMDHMGALFLWEVISLKESHDEIYRSLEDTVACLAKTTETRDPYTAGHQQRVDRLACAIALELGLEQQQISGLHFAAVLHDIGKLALPAMYLSKPTALSSEERAIIKCHAEVGFDILKKIRFPWPVAEIVYQHHELLNGQGYPRGLTEKDILLEAKILTVADVFEAMSADRPYRPSLGVDTALEEIQAGKGVRYHSESVDACVALITEKHFNYH
jgi:putative nucleotidyltransferase with HDIG domain